MIQDLRDHHRVFDTGNDLHSTPAFPAGFDINIASRRLLLVNTRFRRCAQVIAARRSTSVRSCAASGALRLLPGDDAVDDARHPAHDLGPAGEQKAQRKWEAQDPLAYWLFGQNFIDQQRGAFGHATRPATGTEATAFAAEGDQILGVTGLAARPQKPVLKTAAFEVILELPSDIRRQLPALLHQMGSEYRVILVDESCPGPERPGGWWIERSSRSPQLPSRAQPTPIGWGDATDTEDTAKRE